MNPTERFLAYATAFEQTYVDDEWTRLEPYFADEAVYEVDGLGPHVLLTGSAQIFAGIRKSLDGFDRRFSSRKIAVLDGPHVEGSQLDVSWSVTYELEGAPPYVLEGHTVARFAGDRIVYLCDRYTAEMAERGAAWLSRYAPTFDPSYV